jgi:hypothetical protein
VSSSGGDCKTIKHSVKDIEDDKNTLIESMDPVHSDPDKELV